MEEILSNLVYERLLNAKFLIFCNNDDPELVHGFEFSSKKELRDFIVAQKFTCPDCDSKLNTQNIRIAFLKKELAPKTL